MAKRKRDGWKVVQNTKAGFVLATKGGYTASVHAYAVAGIPSVTINVSIGAALTPARAMQFAAKVQAIAERAAKEAR